VLRRMVTHKDKPSAAEPDNMIDVIFVQDSNSNKNSTSVTLCKLCYCSQLFVWSPRRRDV